MLLENKDFLREMGVTQNQVKNFGSNFSSVLGVVGKAAGALGIATTSYEAFNKVLNSSQTLSDKAANSMAAVQNVVDNLAYSIGTFDFSNFNNGLAEMIKKAYDASAALDQLGNTRMSYSYFSSKYGAEFQQAVTTMRDTNASADERKKAEETADAILGKQSAMAQVFTERIKGVINQLSVNKVALSTDYVPDDILDIVLGVDIARNSDELKQRINARVESWKKQIDNVENANRRTWEGTDAYGNAKTFSSVDWHGVKASKDVLNKYYAADIITKGLLEANDDTFLKTLISLAQERDAVLKEIDAMERELNRQGASLERQLNGGSGGSIMAATAVAEDKTPVGYINTMNAKIAELKAQINSATDAPLIRSLQTRLAAAEAELSKFMKTIAAPDLLSVEAIGVSLPQLTGKEFESITAQTSEIAEYSDGINELSSALNSMFATMRRGEPDVTDFINLFAGLLGTFGGTYGAVAGGILSGIGSLFGTRAEESRVIVRGSDIHLALANYNKSLQ